MVSVQRVRKLAGPHRSTACFETRPPGAPQHGQPRRIEESLILRCLVKRGLEGTQCSDPTATVFSRAIGARDQRDEQRPEGKIEKGVGDFPDLRISYIWQ